jgi:hypothetical protein
MRAPLHRRTEKIGACLADPLANGEGAEEIDTFTIPEGAGGGCIDPVASLKRDHRPVNQNDVPGAPLKRRSRFIWPSVSTP